MSRRAVDPVDAAFERWAVLDGEQKRRLADRIAGYERALKVPTVPSTRQRKAKTLTATSDKEQK